MQSTVLFTVLAIGFFINEVSSVQIFDLKSFLKSLQQQLKQEQDALYRNRHYSNEEEDSYGSLKKSDLENLLSYSPKNSKSNRQNKNSKPQSLSQYLELRRPFRQSESLIPNDLTGLLNSIKQQSSYFVSSSESDQRDDEENDSPNEYSKVYIVLNTEAVKRSKNKDKLNALLSSLLAAPPAPVRNAKKQQLKRKVRGRPLQLVQYNKQGYQNYNHNLRLPNRYDDDDRQQNEAWYKEFVLNARRNPSRDSKEKLKARDTIHRLQSSELWKNSQPKTRHTNKEGDLDTITMMNYDKLQPSFVLRRLLRIEVPTIEELDGKRFDEPMERESRPRNRMYDRGMRGGGRGGGGGNNARTAIPYIHHHGDIYEKDD